jgi:MFS family permease
VSELGANVSAIAFPLLVLATTGSPVRAGIVAAAGYLPELVLAVPAGALVDRWDQKRVMIVADSVCAAAFGSLGLAVALDAVTFGHIVAVAFVEGVGFILFGVAEGSALPMNRDRDRDRSASEREHDEGCEEALFGIPVFQLEQSLCHEDVPVTGIPTNGR